MRMCRGGGGREPGGLGGGRGIQPGRRCARRFGDLKGEVSL